MNKKEEIQLQANQDTTAQPQIDAANQELSNRRQLIARYGRHAVVAAPLLLFVSKAYAIHSRP